MERVTMTVKEVSEYLGVSTDTVYRLAREGHLPNARVGHRLLFKRDSIDRFFASEEERNTKKLAPGKGANVR